MLANKFGPDERIGLSKIIISYACIRDLSKLDFDILSDEQKIKLVDGIDIPFTGIFDAFYGLSLCYFTDRIKFNNYWRLMKLLYEVELLKQQQ